MAIVTRIRPAALRKWLPPRKKDVHKGNCGRVLIIAGSRGMAGAAVLSAWGAARTGAGLVRVAVVKSQQPAVVKRAPLEVTTQGLNEDKDGKVSVRAFGQIKRLIEQYRPNVVAIGPGLGNTFATRRLVEEFVYHRNLPLVVDADGLNALARLGHKKRPSSILIMTPHPGEISRLLARPLRKGAGHRIQAALDAAQLFPRSVCLLKGAETLVTDGRRIWKNTTGNPAMAAGGMGDLLTGMIASLWAQMPDQTTDTAVIAACAGAYLHGLAADLSVQTFPERTMLASDVAQALPAAFNNVFRRRK